MLGVPGEFSRGIEWHWSGADNVQNSGGIGKGGEDTKRNLKHVKDRAANVAERPQRVSSVTRIKSTVPACANARTFLRSARSCFGPGAISFQTPTIL